MCTSEGPKSWQYKLLNYQNPGNIHWNYQNLGILYAGIYRYLRITSMFGITRTWVIIHLGITRTWVIIHLGITKIQIKIKWCWMIAKLWKRLFFQKHHFSSFYKSYFGRIYTLLTFSCYVSVVTLTYWCLQIKFGGSLLVSVQGKFRHEKLVAVKWNDRDHK